MKIDGYRDRIIDEVISRYLRVFGAVCVEGPKWCGKTWSSRNQAKSEYFVGSPEGNFQNRRLAELDVNVVFNGEAPHLIDEWQEVPAIWDAARAHVDESREKGRYILTGSSTPNRKGVLHTGTGRIATIRLHTMSLLESGDSEGTVSLRDLCDNKPLPVMPVLDRELNQIAEWIVRGGWPGVLGLQVQDAQMIPRDYITQVEERDIHRIDNIQRDVHKVDLLLRSLARNESTTVSVSTLCSDIAGIDREKVDPDTVSSYLNALSRLFVIENQRPFHSNVRSTVRVKQSEKRHFCDPSLACAILKMTPERVIGDLHFMGFLFEALVARDLRVYASAFGGELYHYQDYAGREADAVIELENGDWAAIEVKLGANQEDAAAAGLIDLRDSILREKCGRPPKSLIVVLGKSSAAYTRKDGVHVVPLSALRP